MGFFLIVKTTLLGICPLFFLILTGIYLTYVKIFNARTSASISQSIGNFLTPVFLFTYISTSFSVFELSVLWPTLVFAFIPFLIFIPLGIFLARVLKFPKGTQKTITCALVLGNYGIVFIIVEGFCSTYGPLSGNSKCSNARVYLSLFSCVENFLRWTIGLSLVALDRQVKDSAENLNGNNTVKVLGVGKLIKNSLFMPNPVASALGIIFALIPGYKNFVMDKSSVFYCLTSVAVEISQFNFVLGQILLGSNLMQIKGKVSNLTTKQIFSFCLAKCGILPLVCLLFCLLCWEIGVFGDDLVMAFCLFASLSSPTAIVVAVFANIYQVAVDEVAEISLWVYTATIPSMIFFNFVFFLLFSSV